MEGLAAAPPTIIKKSNANQMEGGELPRSVKLRGDGSLDYISCLPDDVLRTIISLLPTKDGGRTQAISRRWLPLWRSTPLNLQADYSFINHEGKRFNYISKILSDHHGPAHRLAIPSIRLRDRYDKINGWMLSRALTGLQEIVFSYEIENPLLPYPLPSSVLRFASTLSAAEIGNCQFPNDMASSLNFPCLKKLTLRDVTMSKDAIHSLLSGCIVLESLLLSGSNGIASLRISSPTLKSFGFRVTRQSWGVQGVIFLQELVIEDAPCLERLLPLNPNDNGPATIRVMQAPKLEVLGYLSDGISKLELGTSSFQNMIAVSLTTSMCTVKVLALDSTGPNLDAVVNFMKCFPCLEKLYILSNLVMDMKNKLGWYNPLDPINCLELHLKKVILKNYVGKRPDVDFAKFFVSNAKVLKSMEFEVRSYHNDKWMANQHKRLQLHNRASQDAQFTFKNYIHNSFTGHSHTHDLGIADPFDSSLGK